MKHKLLFILPVLSCLLLAAHFSRVDNNWIAIACLLFPLILFTKKRWVMRVFQLFLLAGGLIWIERTIYLINLRQNSHLPWMRLGIILGSVALFTLLTALVFQNKKIQEIFKTGE
jgi:hypothetical protein